MDEQVTIYALCDESGVRYIGRTGLPVEVRAWQHWMDVATGTAAKIAWITAMRKAGQHPTVKVLEVVTASEAVKAERRHIAAAREQGADLVNATGGRRTSVGPADERDVVRYTLRVPPGLYAQLAALSDAGGWSLHAEILRALHEHVRRRRRPSRAARAAAKEQAE